VIFDLGINAQELDVEVTSVSGRECPSRKPDHHQPPKPRSQRQSHPGVSEQAVKGGKANEQAFIKAATLTRSSTRKASPGQVSRLALFCPCRGEKVA
jgi:hypothetical protein